MASKRNGVLYVGVTSELLHRVWQHKQKLVAGFTKKYNIDLLVYFEQFEDVTYAIAREKQLKNWKRAWTVELIEKTNPEWRDLYEEIL